MLSIASITDGLTLKSLEATCQKFGNYREDLVQDLVSLDKLSGLMPEDRLSRKAAITMIEALPEDVDASRAQIKSLESKLAKLQSCAESAEEHAMAQKASLQAAEPRVAKATPPRSARAACAPAPRPARAADVPSARSFEPDMPSTKLWAQVPLQLRLCAREEEDHYVITVPAEGLTADEVSMRLDEDEERLTIRIFRQPGAEEAAAMRKHVAAHFRQLALRSPARLEQIRRSIGMGELAVSAYARLGQGVFGQFEKSVEIPADADVAGLRSSCSNGVLRAVLPKIVRRSRPCMLQGEGFPAYYAGRPYARPQGFQQHQFIGGYPF